MAEESLDKALLVLLSSNVKRLPVVNEQGQLVGIITERDFRSIGPSSLTVTAENTKESVEFLSKVKVSEVMTKNPFTVREETPIMEAAKLMRLHSISGLPVLTAADKLVGVCSVSDLLDYLIEILDDMKKKLPVKDDLS